jgi:hypothetical protein
MDSRGLICHNLNYGIYYGVWGVRDGQELRYRWDVSPAANVSLTPPCHALRTYLPIMPVD